MAPKPSARKSLVRPSARFLTVLALDSQNPYLGVVSIEVGPPLDMARTKGFDMGIFMVLETKEHLKTFAEHPAHLLYVSTNTWWDFAAKFVNRLHDMRESMSDDSLAFNLPF